MVKVALTALLLFTQSPQESPTYGEVICVQEDFSCIPVFERDSWETLFPDSSQRVLIKRLNRTNVELIPGDLIAVPKLLRFFDIDDFSPFETQTDSITEKTIVWDPINLAFAAYNEDGELVRWGPAVGGRIFCEDIGRPCRTAPGSLGF